MNNSPKYRKQKCQRQICHVLRLSPVTAPLTENVTWSMFSVPWVLYCLDVDHIHIKHVPVSSFKMPLNPINPFPKTHLLFIATGAARIPRFTFSFV